MLRNFRATSRPLRYRPELIGGPAHNSESPHWGAAGQEPCSPQHELRSPANPYQDQPGADLFEDIFVHQETSEEEEVEASSSKIVTCFDGWIRQGPEEAPDKRQEDTAREGGA